MIHNIGMMGVHCHCDGCGKLYKTTKQVEFWVGKMKRGGKNFTPELTVIKSHQEIKRLCAKCNLEAGDIIYQWIMKTGKMPKER